MITWIISEVDCRDISNCLLSFFWWANFIILPTRQEREQKRILNTSCYTDDNARIQIQETFHALESLVEVLKTRYTIHAYLTLRTWSIYLHRLIFANYSQLARARHKKEATCFVTMIYLCASCRVELAQAASEEGIVALFTQKIQMRSAAERRGLWIAP